MGSEGEFSLGGADHPAAADVFAAVEILAAVDLGVLAESDLRRLAVAVQRISRRIDAVSVAIAGQVVETLRPGAGANAPAVAASWLREALTTTARTARGWVATARATLPAIAISGAQIDPEMPVLGAELRSGTVSGEHARVVVATMEKLSRTVDHETRVLCEKVLVDQATRCDPVELTRIGRQIIAMADPDGVLDEYAAHDAMEFHIGRRQANGLTRVWGRLDDVTIEMLYQAMTPLAAPRHRSSDVATSGDRPDTEHQISPSGYRPDTGCHSPSGDRPDAECHPSTPANPTCGSESHHDECPATTGGEPAEGETRVTCNPNQGGSPSPPATDPDGVSAPESGDRRHDWSFDPVVDLGDPDATDGYGRPTWRHGRQPDDRDIDPALLDRRPAAVRRGHALAEILRHALDNGRLPTHGGIRPHITVTIDQRDLLDQIGAAQLDFAGAVTAATARRLACDAGIIPAVLNGDSQVLDLGRTRYTFPPHLRTAITLRDQGCAWPGCDRPPQWTEVHHIRWWNRDLGPTSVDNGCLLCQGHHIEAHRDRWTIRMAADGRPDFIPPAELDPQQAPRRNHRSELALLPRVQRR